MLFLQPDKKKKTIIKERSNMQEQRRWILYEFRLMKEDDAKSIRNPDLNMCTNLYNLNQWNCDEISQAGFLAIIC